MSISAIIITKNEESAIERCITSLSFADEVIVIDAESTDRTVELAKQLGAHVIIHPWQGYGPQKNVGLAAASGDWVLFIDADEEVTPELAAEIQETTSSSAHDVYWLRIVTIFLNKPLYRLYGHNPRLFRRNAARWSNQYVHEQVETMDGMPVILDPLKGNVLPSFLLHHSHPTISSYLTKMHRYTSLDAQQMQRTGKHRSGREITSTLFTPFRLAARQCIKLLFYRKGILDGLPGITWSFLSTYYELEMGFKYLTLTRNR